MGKIVEFARNELGVSLQAGQAEVLDTFEAGGYNEAVIQCGRQSGKSTMADIAVVYNAVVRAEHLRRFIRPNQKLLSAIVAPGLEQAADHITRCVELMESNPRLKALIARATAYELELTNGSIIQAYPCSGRGLRGRTWSCVVLDEFAHFLDSDGSNSAGDVVWSAVKHALVTFGSQGWLISISTPRWRQGAFWDQVEWAMKQGKDSSIYYVKKTTAQMNPTPAVLGEMEKYRLRKPDDYAREFLAEFIEGVNSYLDGTSVLACKRDTDRLPPDERHRYVAAIDPAYQHDNFALCIGHKEDKRIVVDGVWVWWKKGHEFTISQIADLLKAYRVSEVRTDQHAPVPIREALDRHGIIANYIPWTVENKGEAYNRVKVNTSLRTLELPDDTEAISELLSLEARPTAGGFTRIAAFGNAKDDRAIVIASVVQQLDQPSAIAIVFAGDPDSQTDEIRGMWGGDRENADLDAWTRKLSGSNIFG